MNEASGDIKQIGRNCLSDYLGTKDIKNVAMALEMLSLMDFAFNETDDRDPSFVNMGRKRGVMAFDLLAHVRSAIRKYGWMSKGKAYEINKSLGAGDRMAEPTVGIALYYLGGPDPGVPPLEVTDDDYRVAIDAWDAASQISENESNSYLMNLRNLAKSGQFVDFRSAGLAASVIPWYNRKLEEDAKSKAEDKFVQEVDLSNPFVGEKGETVDVELLITDIRGPFENNKFGTSYLYRGVTKDGKIVKWWGPKNEDIEKNGTYTIRGTIQGRGADRYENDPVTQLGRDTGISSGDLEEESGEESSSEKNPFVGEIVNGKGKMETFELIFESAKGPFANQFGASALYFFKDDEGRPVKFFTKPFFDGYEDWSQYAGKRFRIRGKPKSHNKSDMYTGSPVTELTGIRIFEPVDGWKKASSDSLVRKALLEDYLENESSEFRIRVAQKLHSEGYKPPFTIKRIGHMNRKALGVGHGDGLYLFAQSETDTGRWVYALDDKHGLVYRYLDSFSSESLADNFVKELNGLPGCSLRDDRWELVSQ
jgi:hypothetical protein